MMLCKRVVRPRARHSSWWRRGSRAHNVFLQEGGLYMQPERRLACEVKAVK